MLNYIISAERENSDITPIFVGEEKCAPEHNYGPHIRTHTIVHAVISGKGVLTDKHGSHEISAGELFIIRNGEMTVYTADKEEPWHYVWIAFVGNAERLFSEAKSVYDSPGGLTRELCELISRGSVSADAYTAILYSLTAKLFTDTEKTRDRVSEIKKHIEYNYMNDVKVESIAKQYGYERSYLYRIFFSRYGIGIKEYLTEIRMQRAKEFLESGMTVGEAAELVGFRDGFGFSRAFKNHFGVSPALFKPKRNPASERKNPL